MRRPEVLEVEQDLFSLIERADAAAEHDRRWRLIAGHLHRAWTRVREQMHPDDLTGGERPR